MSSSNKERFYSVRRSPPGDSSSQFVGGFFPPGQGRFSQCNVVDQPTQPDPLTYTVPAAYSTSYTQPRSAPHRLWDFDPQTLGYTNQGTLPQFPSAHPNYEIHHERYSPQPSYPTYQTRSITPIMTMQTERKLPPLSTSPPPAERWQQPTFVPQSGFTATGIRSPTATYPTPNHFMQFPSAPPPGVYSYPPLDQVALNQQTMFEDASRLDPRSNSPFRGTGHHPVQVSTQSLTPPPISPTEETTARKPKRRRADANQLKILNETYARTAFPTTEERIALAKLLDMSARSVQIWFQNKRQAMRQTNRQSNSFASQRPYPGDLMEDPATQPSIYGANENIYEKPQTTRPTNRQSNSFVSRRPYQGDLLPEDPGAQSPSTYGPNDNIYEYSHRPYKSRD